MAPHVALKLLGCLRSDVMDLLAEANRVRQHFKGDRVHLCAVINAKSGRCPEDCAFCAQSVHSASKIPTYPLKPADEIFEEARAIEEMGARAVGIVTSGLGPTDKELEVICKVIERIRKELKVLPDASLGMLTEKKARMLKEAGLHGYHHNVETAESFFGRVCSTHPYSQHLETLAIAKAAGFRICSGGIFGLGESLEQRIEMAETLRQVDPDRVCMNFFIPVEGTRIEGGGSLSPMEILKLIAVYRLMLPQQDINVCAGREMHLRDLQGMIFFAGANATMIGNYLTQAGRPASEDLKLVEDAGLKRRGPDEVDSGSIPG